MPTAAAAWEALAAGLESTSRAYCVVISQLQGESWSGSASAAMGSAVAPYLAWATATGAQAEQAASGARAAAAAYEAAFAATVPPALVIANRDQLATLVATNVLGQNTTAIGTCASPGFSETSEPGLILRAWRKEVCSGSEQEVSGRAA
ncbi:hypothetical protein A4G28_06650 [Mycobacterium ostraviense]|uniref:PPE domain-containing protein n=1 Tax=Mycobacterium ostraviense TaxID=2738409 RepID=A0A163TMV5_9MYCO|nr:hypothetical protein A4G28_06650 [Mycobacterium ostraviense]